jgi:hypothetical protein
MNNILICLVLHFIADFIYNIYSEIVRRDS